MHAIFSRFGARSAALLAVLCALPAFPAAAGELDPCQLLTREEVSHAFAIPARPGVIAGLSRRGGQVVGGHCNYRAEASPMTQLSLSLEAYPGLNVPQAFKLSCQRASVKDIAGVGLGACAFVAAGSYVNLTVLVDGALLRFNLVGRDIGDPLAAAREVGRIAAERYGSGAAVTRVAGLEAFLGNWTIHPRARSHRTTGGAVGLINVREQGRWSLVETDVRQGLLATFGEKFVLAVKNFRLEGTYKVRNDRAIEVNGLMNVHFDRIPCGRAPWLVDPELLKRFGVPAKTRQEKPPVDPRWAGLWQGQGQLGGKPVVVLWYVLPGGEARQLVQRDREGGLSATDGHLTFAPNLEQPAEGRYIVHDHESLEVTLPTGTNIWKKRPYGARPKPAALRGPCGETQVK